jgi:ribosomal protein S18 acetylase RimI-like enzyme
MIKQKSTSTKYDIQTAEWKDLNPLRRLERICFPRDRWPLLDLIAVLSFPGIIRYKAVSGGKLIGFIAGEVRRRDNVAWISTVAVHPGYRRQGIASDLLDLCESQLEAPVIRLTVRSTNEGAIHLYEGRGYYRVGIMPGYYQDGEDGIVYEKPIEN